MSDQPIPPPPGAPPNHAAQAAPAWDRPIVRNFLEGWRRMPRPLPELNIGHTASFLSVEFRAASPENGLLLDDSSFTILLPSEEAAAAAANELRAFVATLQPTSKPLAGWRAAAPTPAPSSDSDPFWAALRGLAEAGRTVREQPSLETLTAMHAATRAAREASEAVSSAALVALVRQELPVLPIAREPDWWTGVEVVTPAGKLEIMIEDDEETRAPGWTARLAVQLEGRSPRTIGTDAVLPTLRTALSVLWARLNAESALLAEHSGAIGRAADVLPHGGAS